MRYLSVCSGIEAATVAWHPLGWQPIAFSEIEPFPCAVLAHHYPDVPNLGDMTKAHESEVFRHAAPSVLVGGTPCQAFSVAGLRGGLADPRGNLALVFLGLADRARPRWVVWENVPGVLSSNGGRDFGAFVGALGELGYGFAYRVLDAQFFGVAQRRRRVFVVGHLGGWQRAAAVLFERDSLSGDPAPRREPGSRPAGTVTRSFGERGQPSPDDSGLLVPDVAGTLLAAAGRQRWRSSADDAANGLLIARALTAHNQRFDGPVETLVFDPTQITSVENCSNPQPGDPCHTLPAHGAPPAMAFYSNQGQGGGDNTDLSPPLKIGGGTGAGGPVAASTPAGVRRLTPVECERLQGFPDGYTAVPYRGKAAADGPRYKALGNSMAVPVMAWIGRRIAAVEAI